MPAALVPVRLRTRIRSTPDHVRPVVPARTLPAEQYEKIRKLTIEKRSGLPLGVFAASDNAFTGLGEQAPVPRGLQLDTVIDTAPPSVHRDLP
ncbi:hypothetical protein J2W28_005900 [Variovorax boronicumulans]|uniref:hypothetical protein n=1 Tax=Variovorax boronicumulans TaxID=436515 RepID=UPI00278B9ACA|nr:hypothetical protein [Variovorax boronicumulans]MDP9995439.1 hypothetical protein [Variovorax boronicumulans]MDQ0006729.1 hypothetical protein [Variovorax boronicumulans]